MTESKPRAQSQRNGYGIVIHPIWEQMKYCVLIWEIFYTRIIKLYIVVRLRLRPSGAASNIDTSQIGNSWGAIVQINYQVTQISLSNYINYWFHHDVMWSQNHPTRNQTEPNQTVQYELWHVHERLQRTNTYHHVLIAFMIHWHFSHQSLQRTGRMTDNADVVKMFCKISSNPRVTLTRERQRVSRH